MGRKRGAVKEKVRKKKPVSISLLKREHAGQVTMPYRMMEELVASHHVHLVDARIAIAWNMAAPREGADGLCTMYRVKRGSDLDRELAPYDFVIIINHEIWNKRLTEAEHRGLLDEALCHFATTVDKNGDQKIDEKDRPVFRLRRPEVRTFRENVARFGLWRPEVSKMVDAVASYNDRQRPLLNQNKTPARRFSEPAYPPGEAPANGHANNGHADKPKRSRGKKAGKQAEGAANILERAEELKLAGDFAHAKKFDLAWSEGSNAAQEGRGLVDCTHSPGEMRDDWIRGWLQQQHSVLAKQD